MALLTLIAFDIQNVMYLFDMDKTFNLVFTNAQSLFSNMRLKSSFNFPDLR